MSNKGLTFIIILLLVLCGITFGAFYLKTNPELALSQKIFGTTTASVVKEAETVPDDAYETYTENTNTNINTGIQDIPVVSTVPVESVNNTTPALDTTTPVVVDNTKEEPKVEEVKPVVTTTLISATLKKGSKNNDVKTLQNFLIENEYLVGSADGVFGSKTEAAVKAFQTEYQLKVDGIVGGETRKTINEIIDSN